MLAFGLASVQFFPFLYEEWTEVYVDLPKAESNSPILIVTKPSLTKEYIFKRNLISKRRDLSQFDNGGEYTNQCFSKDDAKECRRKIIEARKFIFDHWKEKKRGAIKKHWSATDISGNDYIFVEPDENGRWRVIFVREYQGIQYANDNLALFEAVSIKYKRATDDMYFAEVGEYFLSFLDENGEEIERL